MRPGSAPRLVELMSDAVGQVVAGRYELTKVIGRGGHSVVYRASDIEGGPDVAVKMLHESVAGDPEYTVRMVREQRAMQRLAGTSAVHVHGLSTSRDGAMCLVMELLNGQDLDDLLAELENRGQRISVSRVLEIIAPIVDTLEVAHGHGIVHRDLKPGNIYIIDREHGGGVRLLDFGLAKMRASRPLTKEGMIIGSPSYIAPEVWKGRPTELDHRVDIYSLGAIIFRALAARVPFPGRTLREKLELTTHGERPSLHELRSELPSEIDRWVEQVLAIEPASRFFRVRAMLNALHEALGVAPVGMLAG